MAYKLTKEIDSLQILDFLYNKYKLYFIEELEIEPLSTWTAEFASQYWYLKYSLLKRKEAELILETEEFEYFFKQKNLDILHFCVTDNNTFILRYSHSKWEIESIASKFELLSELINEIKNTKIG